MDTETLRQSLLALLTPSAHPLTAFRIDQILALHRIVTQLEEALASLPIHVQDPKRGPRLHPVLDALAKNRERLRLAMNDLERTLPRPPRPAKNDKGSPPLAAPDDETIEKCGSVEAPAPHPAPAVEANLRVRPPHGKSAPPSNPARTGFLRHAYADILGPEPAHRSGTSHTSAT